MRISDWSSDVCSSDLDAEQRLERVREQIPIRVAHEVPQLGCLDTASVGMVIAPRRAVPKAGFALLYNHADRLLYEAKSRGRNRIACEKLCGFDRRKRSEEHTSELQSLMRTSYAV